MIDVHQAKTWLLRTGVLLIAVATLLTPAHAAAATVSHQSIAVPLYQYPTIGTMWDDVTGQGGANVPFVIITPNSGPGVSVDPTYTAEIAENTTEGIRTFGYVYTSYQSRTWQDVYDDIDDWYQMYPGISGIFIDLVQTGTAADVCYIASLYNHVKYTHPSDAVILNPGTHISDAYEPYGDIFMNAENTYAAYNSSWSIIYPGFEDNPAYENRFWHAIHTVNVSEYAAALAKARANNAGWVYLTDDTTPNAYKATPSYWTTEVDDVNNLPPSTMPNRGKTQLPSGCVDITATTSEATTTLRSGARTTSTLQVANLTSAYPADAGSSVHFTLPTGVKFDGQGANWTCDDSGLCTYHNSIGVGAVAGALVANFTQPCGFSGGQVQGSVRNFTGTASSLTVPLSVTAACPAATLVDAGLTTLIFSSFAAILIFAAMRIYLTRRLTRMPAPARIARQQDDQQ